ncbi:hypothetical protein RCS94_08355 [Orbaceae bacterium ac157xtp]
MIVPSSYGALSATSANVIQGHIPGFSGQSGAKKLGFKVNGVEYSEGNRNINSNTAKEFDPSLKLSDFQIRSLNVSDFNIATDYYDSDGDVADPNTPFSIGGVTYEWKDGYGVKIDDMTKTIGCSQLRMPLKLTITLNNVQVHSKYGVPKDSGNTLLTQSYQIVPSAGGICFVRPNSMKVYPGKQWLSDAGRWNIGGSNISSVYGGGYSSDFIVVTNSQGNVIDGGFNPNAYQKFPTTGFQGAIFQLVMSGSQTDYTYNISASPSGSVTVDSSGNIKLNSKPYGSVTVSATLRSDSSKQYVYTFNPTSVWIVPKLGLYEYWDGVALCGGQGNLPSRSELTNSPGIYATNQTWQSKNYYTRAIGGGVFAEWGITNASSYPGFIGAGSYWTRDPWSSVVSFSVNPENGFVGRVRIADRTEVACLG